MKIIPHRKFKKQFRKLRKGDQKRFEQRIKIFITDPFAPILNNHKLHGKYTGYHSINITSDLRAVYKLLNTNSVIFVDIDTHSNLYS